MLFQKDKYPDLKRGGISNQWYQAVPEIKSSIKTLASHFYIPIWVARKNGVWVTTTEVMGGSQMWACYLQSSMFIDSTKLVDICTGIRST